MSSVEVLSRYSSAFQGLDSPSSLYQVVHPLLSTLPNKFAAHIAMNPIRECPSITLDAGTPSPVRPSLPSSTSPALRPPSYPHTYLPVSPFTSHTTLLHLHPSIHPLPQNHSSRSQTAAASTPTIIIPSASSAAASRAISPTPSNTTAQTFHPRSSTPTPNPSQPSPPSLPPSRRSAWTKKAVYRAGLGDVEGS